MTVPPRVAIGVDMVEVHRIARLAERFGDRFGLRIFTPAEWQACRGRPASLAARFAAKEAVSKALGCGLGELGTRGVRATDIEVVTGASGEPTLVLHGTARARAESSGIGAWSISLSHTRELAIAMVAGVRAAGG